MPQLLTRVRLLPSILLMTLIFWTTPLSAQQWTQFRGCSGQGVCEQSQPPVEFGENHNLRWKREIPGLGWSSPVIRDDEVWLTSAVPEPSTRSLGLYAVCVDLQSGEIRRAVLLFDLQSPERIHDDNSYASPTPVIDAEQVYCHFGTFGTAAIERASGKIRWKNETLQIDHQGGPGSSPVAYQEFLIVTCDGADEQYIAALRKSDGSIAWKQARSAPQRPDPITHRAFATPLIWKRPEGDLLISPAADQVHACNPLTGEELWHVRYLGFSNVPAPVTDGQNVFICTGFFTPMLLAIDPTGRGNVTQSHVRWQFERGVTTIPSPIVQGSTLYTVNEGGILTSLDCQTGQVIRKRRMVGNYSASPILAGGLLYFCSEEGKVTLIEPDKQLSIRQVNHLDGCIKASPAPCGDSLILRTDSHLYCFQKESK